MNSMTRVMSRTLVASLLVFLAACSDSGDGVLYSGDLPAAPEASTPAPEPSAGNIVEVATASGSFPTLLAAVEAAGLADALSDESASLTVFAPTEEAFAALPEGTLDALLADPEALAGILTYHVLGSEVGVSAALDLAPTTVETLNGVDVALTKRDDDYLYVNLSKVVDYDIEASNGVIHVVDSVLLPPDLTPSTMTIAEIASSNDDFETLVAAATAANLVATLNDPDASLTVFAPTDAAFEALGDATLNYLLNNLDVLESTLLYHVVAGAELSSIDAIAAAGSAVGMANGDEATISLGDSGLMIESANIVVTDIVASNGIIHVIDSVLEAPSATGAPLAVALASDGSFSTLSGLLEDAGLTETLMDPNANVTIFAPTDDAFAQMEKAGLFTKFAAKDGEYVADFTTGSFGDAIVDPETETYTFPTGAQDWAGFANNADIYPLTFAEGGTITFTASAAVPTNVRFRFEFMPFPDVDPAYDTEAVLIDSAEATEYTIEIPSQGENTFSSFLLYLGERDQPVVVSNVVVSNNTTPEPEPDADLVNLLTYHVYGDTVYSGDAIALDGNSIEMLNGESVAISVQDDALYVNDARVTTADIAAGNGVIHAINKVLSLPGDPNAVVADFTTGAFGNAVVDAETETYTFPSGAEGWAGFANNADIYPLSFTDGGTLTFTASAAVPTNVRFRFEFMPFPDVDPAYDTANVLIDSTEPTQYTIEIPSQGDNTFSSFLLYLVERDQSVMVSNVVVSSGAAEPEPEPPANGVTADFTAGAFGNAVVDAETETYTFPSGAEGWAGFANNADIYPLSFTDGGTLTFTASAAVPTNVRFRFEFMPFPDVDPAYDTANVLIDSTEPTQYTIEIPSQGDNTFSSFLLYLVERDQSVMVSNVVVSSGAAEPEPEPPANGVTADFTAGAFGNAVVDAETETYTFPSGAEGWAGFANNADIYPLTFPVGGKVTFTASAATATNLRFRFEFMPFPDVDPAYDAANVLIDSTEAMEYSVEVPSQGDNTFSSFLLYLVERDSPVVVTNIVVSSYIAAN
ncbi:fasciclin domain-containing protein [Luminiphilus sp.]|nr:fasciclin domain-containing protein [Luminiphilus sp.]MDB2660516.1 fasciclin domain-containing protein [Luminiphilus sp.]